jgi:hypothetical protein
MSTENKPETAMFEVDSCYQFCKDPDHAKLKPADLNCQDLNDAEWTQLNAGWERFLDCTWKGF